jgi:hypothetical protein
MTKTATILKAMQTILLVTVFMPAPLFAEPALTARQMLALAQTQSQDNAVKGEVEKMTSHRPILTGAQAAEPANPNLQRPVVTAKISAPLASPPVAPAPAAASEVDAPAPTQSATEKASTSPVDVAAAVTAAPRAQVAGSSIVALPAPRPAADITTAEAVTNTDTATPASNTEAAMPAPASPLPTRDTASDAPKADNAAIAPAAGKAVALTETVATPGSSRHPHRPHPNSIYEIGNVSIRTQVQRILNRPETRLLIARYSLN